MSEFVTGPRVIGADEDPTRPDRIFEIERDGGRLVMPSTQCSVFGWSLTARYG